MVVVILESSKQILSLVVLNSKTNIDCSPDISEESPPIADTEFPLKFNSKLFENSQRSALHPQSFC